MGAAGVDGMRRPFLATIAAVVLAGSLLVAQPAAAAPSTAASTCSATAITKAKAMILKEVNAARKKSKLPALKEVGSMDTVARNWSVKQASAGRMSHNKSYSKQLPKGWSSAGENVAFGYVAANVTKAWLKSPGHRANILKKSYTHIGIGITCGKYGTPYYTQNFAGYSKAKAPKR